MMSWIGVLAVGLVLLLVIFQLRVYTQSKALVGTNAPPLGTQDAAAGDKGGRSLIYFHSPACGPCRRMSPLIESLAERYTGVNSVDVSSDLETARKYNIRATPTTILVEAGVIRKVLLGPQTEQRLLALLRP